MTGSWEQAGAMHVVDALNRALERSRRILLMPAKAERWLMFGVLAFLDVYLAGGGAWRSGANLSFNSGGYRGGPWSTPEIQDTVDWFVANLAFVALFVLPFLVFGIALYVAALWVGCRGQLMLVRAVAQGSDRISEHWGAVKRPAQSLFLFRLELCAFSILFALGVAGLGFLMLRTGPTERTPQELLVLLAPLIVTYVVVGAGLLLVQVLLRSFVVPLMFHFDLTCWEAWGAFRQVAHGNGLGIVAYLLIKFVYTLGFFVATLLVGCVTCCVGLLPVIHHALFAPFYVFDRAFSMCLLETCGDGYRMFSPDAPSLPPLPSAGVETSPERGD